MPVSYELYVKQRGRWILEVQFAGHLRQAAIEEAKDLQRQDHYELLKEDMIDFTKSIGMPDMSYGWAKLTCEYLARLAYEKHGLKSIVYRPFSGYGEDQDVWSPDQLRATYRQ